MQKMNITEFNVALKATITALKAIIPTSDILKVAKSSELHLKEDTAGPCSLFLRCFHLNKVNWNEVFLSQIAGLLHEEDWDEPWKFCTGSREQSWWDGMGRAEGEKGGDQWRLTDELRLQWPALKCRSKMWPEWAIKGMENCWGKNQALI